MEAETETKQRQKKRRISIIDYKNHKMVGTLIELKGKTGKSEATMHIIYDMVAPNVNIPFFSIPEAAVEYAVSKGYHRVGLLGIIFTMEKDYLSKTFLQRGIEVIVPDADIRVLVNERISKGLEYGIIKESTIEELKQVILNMKNEQGIEAVILGCTELPLQSMKKYLLFHVSISWKSIFRNWWK